MYDRNGRIGRRDALRTALGVGAGLALRPRDLWAHEAGWEELRAASLVTRPTPSTGERLPVIGIGTARRYDVADSGLFSTQRSVLDAAPRRRMAALVDAS